MVLIIERDIHTMSIRIQAIDFREREVEKTQDFQENINQAQKRKNSLAMPRPSQETNGELREHRWNTPKIWGFPSIGKVSNFRKRNRTQYNNRAQLRIIKPFHLVWSRIRNSSEGVSNRGGMGDIYNPLMCLLLIFQNLQSAYLCFLNTFLTRF